MKKQEKKSKEDKIIEKIENLYFAFEHSDEEKDFLKMIEEEKEKLSKLNEEW